MLVFQGEKQFGNEPAIVWARLRDASFLVQCIPDASIEGAPTRDEAFASVRPGFSFVRGNLDITLHIIGSDEPRLVKALVLSKGVGANSEIEVAVAVSAGGQGTHVEWNAEVKTLGGLLKMAPTGLVRGAAQKVIEDVWANIEQRLASELRTQ